MGEGEARVWLRSRGLGSGSSATPPERKQVRGERGERCLRGV